MIMNKKKYDMYLICRRNDNKGEKNETNILRNRYKNQQKLPKILCVLCFLPLVCLWCN